MEPHDAIRHSLDYATTTYSGRADQMVYSRGGWLPPASTSAIQIRSDECIVAQRGGRMVCVRAGHVGLNKPHTGATGA